jgi:hypothetical protein
VSAKISAANCKPDRMHTLPRDNWTSGDFWLLCDGAEVTLCAQKFGESPTAKVSIPRRQFNRLIAGYLKAKP